MNDQHDSTEEAAATNEIEKKSVKDDLDSRVGMMPRECETDFKLDRHYIPFLQNVAFFAEISRHVRKIPTRDIPTAGVTFDPKTDDITLFWNPDFLEKLEAFNKQEKDLGDTMIHSLLTHEFYHLVFRHLSSRRKTPGDWWNVATDAAINSIITTNENNRGGIGILPPGGIIPGKWPTKPDGRELTAEEKTAAPFAKEIASWPPGQASEVYYMLIQQYVNENAKGKKLKGGNGEAGNAEDKLDGFDSMDSHDLWDQIPEELREIVDGRLRELVRQATTHADTRPNGWGNIPSTMQSEIRKSISNEVDWRLLLKQFFGTLIRGDRSTSIKRINRRYPYVHPGVKRNHVPKVLIAYDRSGSVSDEACELFFGECATLSRNVDFDVVEFDVMCGPVESWRRNAGPPTIARRRQRCGGTDFDAPAKLVNAQENRGRWDGLIYMTDGECSEPVSTRIKRAWVIAPDRKLLFNTTDTVINLTKDTTIKGSWR